MESGDDWPERGHGDDGVPERDRDAGEVSAGDVLLGVEHDRREDDDGHGEREDEEAELAGARLERVAEDAQAGRVTRELEYPAPPPPPPAAAAALRPQPCWPQGDYLLGDPKPGHNKKSKLPS